MIVQARSAVFARQHAKGLPEAAPEMGHIVEAPGISDFADAAIGLRGVIERLAAAGQAPG